MDKCRDCGVPMDNDWYCEACAEARREERLYEAALDRQYDRLEEQGISRWRGIDD